MNSKPCKKNMENVRGMWMDLGWDLEGTWVRHRRHVDDVSAN